MRPETCYQKSMRFGDDVRLPPASFLPLFRIKKLQEYLR